MSSGLSKIITPRLANDLFKERSKRKRQAGRSIDRLIARLFDRQRLIVEDSSRQIAGLCSRRAGKTFTASSMLLMTALLHPGSISVYVGVARKYAKNQVWNGEDGILSVAASCGIEGKANSSDLQFTLTNGSVIWLVGVDDERQAHKLRGGRYHIVIVDEAQNYRSDVLDPLLEEVLPAALSDYQGKLVLLGTPGVVASGKFHEVTNGATGWSVHRWTVVDNAFFPEGLRRFRVGLARTVAEGNRQVIDEDIERRGLSVNSPAVQREWFGQWTADEDYLLYKHDPVRDCYEELPPAIEWSHVMGVDLGFNDAFSIVVWAYSMQCRTAYQVHTFKKSRLGSIAQIEHIARVAERYGPECIVVDPATGGKSVIEDLIERHGLPVQHAQKAAKAATVETLNGQLTAGLLKVLVGDPLSEEWLGIQKNPMTGIEMPGSEDHASDAALYAFREIPHHRGVIEAELPAFEDPFRQLIHERARRAESLSTYDMNPASRW